MDEREVKRQVILAGKELIRRGLITRTWGNVSCRADDETFFITASGRDYQTLTEEEVVRVRLSDLSYEGRFLPSSEKKIHREIYRMKTDARFVIHTHQDNASAVSAMGKSFVRMPGSYPGIGKTLICADYGLSGTDRLCSNVKKALSISEGNVVILRNHGAVCYGRDYEEALAAACSLEEACEAYLKKLNPGILSRNKGDIREVGKHIIWNRSQILLDFAEKNKVMRPYLDDFAQLAGLKMDVLPQDQGAAEHAVRRGHPVIVRGIGALVTADTKEDALALSKITEKNAMAFFAARAVEGRPIKRRYCARMRRKYLRSYSKRIR